MRVLGIDMGSREVKIILLENGQTVLRKKISTMQFYRDHCRKEDRLIVDTKSLGIDQFDLGVSTGYGRNNTDLNDFTQINEVKAHVYGALKQSGQETFVLLDVGGQDVKLAKVEKSIMTDLELNEKCAASCGRYLENMAHVLEVGLDELGEHHENPIDLNATCAIFTESELIGHIANGDSTEALCAGVNFALYKRIKPMLMRFNGNQVVIGGGVAHNKALHQYLKSDYDTVTALEDPQFNGAIGCCHFGELKLKSGLKRGQINV